MTIHHELILAVTAPPLAGQRRSPKNTYEVLPYELLLSITTSTIEKVIIPALYIVILLFNALNTITQGSVVQRTRIAMQIFLCVRNSLS